MKNVFKTIFIGIALTSICLPAFAAEREYELLQPLPGIVESGTSEKIVESYIPGVIKLLIGVAGGLAVLKIIFGGIQYMSTDAFQGKNDARKTIQDALWGFLLAISAFVILNTINPKLVNLDIVIPSLKLGPAPDTSTGPAVAAGTSKFTNFTNPVEAGCTNNCVAIKDYAIPAKIPVAKGCSNVICFINKDFAVKLASLNTELINTKPSAIRWQVTEMYPPSVPHDDPCHKSGAAAGTCVDASLDSRNRTPKDVAIFLAAVEKNVSSNYLYEVPNGVREGFLKNHPDLKKYSSKIKNTGQSEHIHLRMQ